MDTKKQIVRKWYEKLEFPAHFDELFEDVLNRKEIPENCVLARYNELMDQHGDVELNMMMLLYLCEELQQWFFDRGISEEIFVHTMKDLILWAEDYFKQSGGVFGIAFEVLWLGTYYSGRLFRLGRLEFERATAWRDIPGTHIKNGDTYISVHIPEGEAMTPEACQASFDMAMEFFPKHFPEHQFDSFLCHTWMFDEQLKTVLSPNSNIVKFFDFFEVVNQEESDEIIRHIFGNGSTRENILDRPCNSSLTKWIVKTVKENGKFYEGYGIRRVAKD